VDKQLTLSDWITEVSAYEVARLLKIDEVSVYQWRQRHCLPRPAMMMKIKTLSKGRVTYEGMIEPFIKNPRKSTRKNRGN
jgi:hypothetical protein